MAATPHHSLPRVSQCGQGSYSLDRRRPATLIAHCASSSPALPMSLGLKHLLWRDAPVSSLFFHPPLIFSRSPAAPHPRGPQIAQCSPQSPAPGFRLCQLVRPSLYEILCCCTPTPSEPHILSHLLVVTSESQISVDIHLNDYLASNCG